MNNIVTNLELLRKPCFPVDLEEGVRIGEILFETLRAHKNGVGLAANQIGINKRVCLICVKSPIVLVNPCVVNGFDKVRFDEGCLSFPGEVVVTERFRNVLIKADNYQDTLTLYGDEKMDLLESVCIQHEIDHLNGLTMYDRISTEDTEK